jgi:hypothetical protein
LSWALLSEASQAKVTEDTMYMATHLSTCTHVPIVMYVTYTNLEPTGFKFFLSISTLH